MNTNIRSTIAALTVFTALLVSALAGAYFSKADAATRPVWVYSNNIYKTHAVKHVTQLLTDSTHPNDWRVRVQVSSDGHRVYTGIMGRESQARVITRYRYNTGLHKVRVYVRHHLIKVIKVRTNLHSHGVG